MTTVPVILADDPASFAHSVLAERHPALIRQVREAFPFPPDRRLALDDLLAEITEGTIQPLPPGVPDHEQWLSWGAEYLGRSWFDVPFLWSESYFYRRLLDATGYFGPGPWQGVDPFGPFKGAELRSTKVDDELAALDALVGRTEDEQAYALLRASLWGNRADLGFSAATGEGPGSPAEHLVADDSARLWTLLPPGAPGAVVHLIADNAGRELVPDLVLLDHLVGTGRASRAVLHVKPGPYYVSDATTADVVAVLRRLRAAPGRAGEIGARLWAALNSGTLAVRAHAFFCAPFPYEAMPDDLRRDLAEATVTLVKGDLNYRRLVGDRHWPATTPFGERTAYFPGPVAALRTLKSDVAVGLDAGTVAGLDATGSSWRVNGTHALVQLAP